MSTRGFRCVVLYYAAGLVACGGSGGSPTGTSSTPTPAPNPTPTPVAACTVPPLNTLPNPAPRSSYIDSDPTGACLKNGETARITFTNRGTSGSLKFVGFAFVGQEGSGSFDIPGNNCQQQLPGRTLFPAAVCTVDVRGTCPGGTTKARLQANSNAVNSPHYEIPVECSP